MLKGVVKMVVVMAMVVLFGNGNWNTIDTMAKDNDVMFDAVWDETIAMIESDEDFELISLNGNECIYGLKNGYFFRLDDGEDYNIVKATKNDWNNTIDMECFKPVYVGYGIDILFGYTWVKGTTVRW